MRQVAAEGALREQLIERAELEAAQAAEAAGAAELAAANRAKLEEFKAETLAGEVKCNNSSNWQASLTC